MHTDWLAVVLSILCFAFGVVSVRFTTPISGAMRRKALARERPTLGTGPTAVRYGGFAFIAFGVMGTILGLFFADKM